MDNDIYQRLAKHLDDLPGGYPAAESGVEQRILRRLFTPEDAELAVHLTLLAEEPRVVALRAGIPLEEAAQRLDAMEKKGLIYGERVDGRAPRYMAAQFAVGIWEYQLKHLTPELARDFEEYLPILFDPDIWKQTPQLRTVPVGEAVDVRLEILDYERAEALVQRQDRFAVAPCICRTEKRLLGEDCGKPLETCLTFGGGADFYLRHGMGRAITKEEALGILRTAEEAGLVLQPGNSRDAAFICTCCGCCCGVLNALKQHPNPGLLVSSPFIAALDRESCAGCGLCLERCQMEALRLDDGAAVLDEGRCIGCGLCVTTCPSGSLSLQRKPKTDQRHVPRSVAETYIRLGMARGKLKPRSMAGMAVKSGMDRLKSG